MIKQEEIKDMTAVEVLNYYRNLYYKESMTTERGIVANAINDFFKEIMPLIQSEIKGNLIIHDNIIVKNVAENLPHPFYAANEQAAEELMTLFDRLAKKPLTTAADYVEMYDANFYTYKTWEELLESEKEQGSYGLSEEECTKELNHSIWQLPCGWFVQCV